MSKWKTAIHTIKRAFMCCVRCVEITDRMTRTASEEMEANERDINHRSSKEDRKSSIAKIVITSGQNEEYIEFTQPISIRYMGEVHIHNESHYYTPNRTPIDTPTGTPANSTVDLSKYIQHALVDRGTQDLRRRLQRKTVPSLSGDRLRQSVLQQVMEEENNPNNLIVPAL